MGALASVKASSILGTMVRTTSATVGQDKTFDPEGINPQGVARWVDRSGGIALLYPAITMQVRAPTKVSRVYKVTAKLVLPTGDITAPTTTTGIQPAPSKAYDCSCVMEFMIPERSSLAERQALFSLAHSLFVSTINASDDVPTDATGMPLKAAVESFETIY